MQNDQYYTKLSNVMDDINSQIKENSETLNNLELEKCLIITMQKEKESQIIQRENVLKKLQSDKNNLDYLSKKENENLNNAKNGKFYK